MDTSLLLDFLSLRNPILTPGTFFTQGTQFLLPGLSLPKGPKFYSRDFLYPRDPIFTPRASFPFVTEFLQPGPKVPFPSPPSVCGSFLSPEDPLHLPLPWVHSSPSPGPPFPFPGSHLSLPWVPPFHSPGPTFHFPGSPFPFLGSHLPGSLLPQVPPSPSSRGRKEDSRGTR
jgi:hypothetical protein